MAVKFEVYEYYQSDGKHAEREMKEIEKSAEQKPINRQP
jgi:hypothetical protein